MHAPAVRNRIADLAEKGYVGFLVRDGDLICG
jgi:hypothetical protein